jgi:hypothetical protein
MRSNEILFVMMCDERGYIIRGSLFLVGWLGIVPIPRSPES